MNLFARSIGKKPPTWKQFAATPDESKSHRINICGCNVKRILLARWKPLDRIRLFYGKNEPAFQNSWCSLHPQTSFITFHIELISSPESLSLQIRCTIATGSENNRSFVLWFKEIVLHEHFEYIWGKYRMLMIRPKNDEYVLVRWGCILLLKNSQCTLLNSF